MSTVPTVTPTEEELKNLPYDFTDLVIYQESGQRVAYAVWNDRDVTKPHGKPWQFEHSGEVITRDDWEQFYPNHSRVHVTNHHSLEGTFDTKYVWWSKSQNSWVYGNNKPVHFPPPVSSDSESGDEGAVTAILERTEQTLVAATSVLSGLTPERTPTPRTVPGALPDTPIASTSWGQYFPTPLSPSTHLQPPAVKEENSSPTTVLQPVVRPPTPVTLYVPPPVARNRPMANPAPKNRGSAPEAYEGKPIDAENFWTALESYYWLNNDVYANENEKVFAALTHFKVGTPAGQWARECQKAALATNPPNFGTWPQFKTKFTAHFVPADLEIESANAMHTTHMGSRPFNEWYQEWSVHASRAGVDDKTKMYAFRNNLPEALHNKLLGVTLQPTMLTALVDLTRAFDQAYHTYRQNRPGGSSSNNNRARNTRAVTTETTTPMPVNYANLEAYEGKITAEEKERRFREKLCFYCSAKNHRAKDCRKKKRSRPNNSNYTPRDTRARAVSTQEKTQEEESPSPPFDHGPSVSSIYAPSNRFDPLSAPLNDEDF